MLFTWRVHVFQLNCCQNKSTSRLFIKHFIFIHNRFSYVLFQRKSPTGSRVNRNRRRKRNRTCAVNNHDQLSSINRIEILPNGSKFAVFSAIRAIIMESESKSQSLFDILENSKKMQCHQASKQQDADTDAESLMGDLTEKQLTLPIPQVGFGSFLLWI